MERPPKIDDKEYENILKSIPRDHLLAAKTNIASCYMP
jgi:hypothetical protein